MARLHTIADVMARYGVNRARAHQLAKARKCGKAINDRGDLRFSERELERMRPRATGRPRKVTPVTAASPAPPR